ncbi:MAG: bifunctional DNA-formamidopyrimidine glycosylase/DNA-(apurinic or apyrimidinic site) lyase [Patescibacteria group bacterium]|nr:bifunctional DNA-formamidopyrimidine glycosylase/DNA-(apurinic or apyrimidinic site) lyase [Patescibacteria group bacterium]
MPELPEVETITNDLKHTVVGAVITDFWANSSKQVIPGVKTVKTAAIGKKIVSAKRRAKLILLQLNSYSSNVARSSRSALQNSNNKSIYLGIHLKMTGRLLLRRKKDLPDPCTRAIFTLQKNSNVRHSGERQRLQNRFRTQLRKSYAGQARQNDEEKILELRFCDIRKFGYIRLFKNKEELKSVVDSKLGPEPYSEKFTASYLKKVLAKKNVAIKTALMDQTLISGIGNIYSNEALFLVGIDPRRKAKSLKFKECKSLKDNIQKVLKKGIKYRGSSAKDESYRDLYGELGLYQNHFLVYEQKGRRCQKCQSVIEYQKVNGRGTFWCPKCQK